MKQVIKVTLCDRSFELEQDAYAELSSYLERAARRLGTRPDQVEIIADLERSIAERLARFSAGTSVPIIKEYVAFVLREVGDVETGDDERPAPSPAQAPKQRRLYRIKERQQIAGVCAGLAEYAELDVSLVRWIFIGLTGLTSGLFALVYILMMFIFPVADAPAEFKCAVTKC